MSTVLRSRPAPVAWNLLVWALTAAALALLLAWVVGGGLGLTARNSTISWRPSRGIMCRVVIAPSPDQSQPLPGRSLTATA